MGGGQQASAERALVPRLPVQKEKSMDLPSAGNSAATLVCNGGCVTVPASPSHLCVVSLALDGSAPQQS